MKKYYGIEFLRFLTSVSIILYHYRLFFEPFNTLSSKNFSSTVHKLPFSPVLEVFYINGIFGVPVFYAISGFVFSFVYLSPLKKTHYKEFFINRFARLYPLHFLTLIIVLLLQYTSLINFDSFQFNLINDFYHFALQIFFISAWGFEEGHSFNSPIWSVSVEIAIYIIFFFLINTIKKYRTYFVFLVVILLTVIGKHYDFHKLFLECARLFFSGVLVFYLCNEKKYLSFLSAGSVLLVIFSFIGNFKLFIFCPALLMFFVTIEEILEKNKIKSIFKNLGNLTYSLYLIHVPLQIFIVLLTGYFNISESLFLSPLFFILYLIITFLLAYCSFTYYEFPLNNSIRRKLKNH